MFILEQTCSSNSRYALQMLDIVLTKAEYAALAAIDGTSKQPTMTPAMQSRLSLLRLTERREWPNGPLWRTARGDRHVKRGPVSTR